MQVVAGVELPGEGIERVVESVAVEHRKIAHHRPVGDAADGEADTVARADRRTGDDGKVAVTAAELRESVAVIQAASWER